MRRQMPDGTYADLGPGIGRPHNEPSYVKLGPPQPTPTDGRSWRTSPTAIRPHFPGARRAAA